MVPTYFRRELRDRVLQRRLRLRTSVFCTGCTWVFPCCFPSSCCGG